ncbi:MAG: hypothetical protein ACRDJW_05080 [Thermomicrobiales bacterium]
MPDRDVFDRTVRPGWQTAARRMIGAADDPDALVSVIRALANEAKKVGCPGFDQIVGIVVDVLHQPDYRAARQLANQRLDRIRREQASGVAEQAVNAAKGLLVDRAPFAWSLGRVDDEARIDVASQILATLADYWMCPTRLLVEIIEQGQVSFQEVRARRERAMKMLVSALETRRLAEQLLADPSGALVKRPQISRAKLTQAEILVTALTE